MQKNSSGPVDVMIDEVSYHGNWHLSGDKLKVSYGSWEEATTVMDGSPVIEEVAKRLLSELIDRDLTYRGRTPKI